MEPISGSSASGANDANAGPLEADPRGPGWTQKTSQGRPTTTGIPPRAYVGIGRFAIDLPTAAGPASASAAPTSATRETPRTAERQGCVLPVAHWLRGDAVEQAEADARRCWSDHEHTPGSHALTRI